MRDPRTFSPEDHRLAACGLLEEVRGNPDAIPEQRTALATAALAYALLAQPPHAEGHDDGTTVTWPGFAALTVLCATVVVTVWMLTR